jgi:hypothetical protein
VDEICGPTRIRAGLDEQRCSRANGTLATTTLANCQTFLSIEAYLPIFIILRGDGQRINAEFV